MNPNKPLLKIDRTEFNLIKSGIYRTHNIRFMFGDNGYYISKNLFNKIEHVISKMKIVGDLSFSFREFTDADVIKELDLKIDLSQIEHLKNVNDDIYLVSSKNIEKKSALMINKLVQELLDMGIIVKKVYYLNQSYFGNNKDINLRRLCNAILSIAYGLEIKEGKFIENADVVAYREVYYYDSNMVIANRIKKELNIFLNTILIQSKMSMEKFINTTFFVCEVTSNMLNRFITTKIAMYSQNIYKSFDMFKKMFNPQ